jgi:VIT1/CCC1 family predicted Fe2+/Mn2+ transporter
LDHIDDSTKKQPPENASTKSRAATETGQARGVPTEEIHKPIDGRGLISNAALGLTDGLVTNLAFLAGFAGAGYGTHVIQFAGAAAMIAGAVSMFFSGLLAARSERQLFVADARREAEEIEEEPEEEKAELKSFYLEKGLNEREANLIVDRISKNKRVWLNDLLVHELHIHEEKLENPLKIATVTGLAFLGGALVPLSVYFLALPRIDIIELSIALSLAFLFLAGSWKGRIANQKAWKTGLEMLGIGVAASSLLYLIGLLLVFA